MTSLWGAAQLPLWDRTTVLLFRDTGDMKKAAVARCGNPVALYFAPGGIGLSQHRRFRYLLGMSLIYSGLWL